MTTLSDDILTQLEGQGIELPSWAFGNSGTRFRVWTTEGTPRDPREKIADAAQVNKHTALAPSVKNDDEPAVVMPYFLSKTGRNFAKTSGVLSPRGPSSFSMASKFGGSWTGTTASS